MSQWGDVSSTSMRNKEKKLIMLRGMNERVRKLRGLTRDHFNSGSWDTEESGKNAVRLLDEVIDLARTARKELA
jgi:hypothetical protein